MAIDGYGKNIPEKVFYKLGALCELDAKEVRRIFAETFEALSHWSVLANDLGIAVHNRDEIQESFNVLFKQYRQLA